jgi:hypothetical protein
MSATFHTARADAPSAQTSPAVARCVDGIVAATEDVFAGLATMAAAMLDSWDDERRFGARDLAALRPHIFEQLDRHPAFDSAGYVMSEPALADEPRHLEWWYRNDSNGYEELVLPVQPGVADCYDYYSMEWFLAALTEQRRFASGPKIDLPCADVYIITFAYPVVADGAVLGVSAADVALSRFESSIRPPLQRLPAPAVLVNSERRVITSNDPQWTTGEKLRELPAAEEPGWRTVVPVTDDLGWLLAVAAPTGH